MKNLLQVMLVVLVGVVATGCANNDKADEALRTAQEAKNIAEATQAQFSKYFQPSRYK